MLNGRAEGPTGCMETGMVSTPSLPNAPAWLAPLLERSPKPLQWSAMWQTHQSHLLLMLCWQKFALFVDFKRKRQRRRKGGNKSRAKKMVFEHSLGPTLWTSAKGLCISTSREMQRMSYITFKSNSQNALFNFNIPVLLKNRHISTSTHLGTNITSWLKPHQGRQQSQTYTVQ